jgi:hypothetical protein
MQATQFRRAAVRQHLGQRRKRHVGHAERVGTRAQTDARRGNRDGAEHGLQRAGTLVAQAPQCHAVGADPGASDVLCNLVLDDALLQLGQQRLGLGQGKPNALAAEVMEVTAKAAYFIGCHLSPTRFALQAGSSIPWRSLQARSRQGVTAGLARPCFFHSRR